MVFSVIILINNNIPLTVSNYSVIYYLLIKFSVTQDVWMKKTKIAMDGMVKPF